MIKSPHATRLTLYGERNMSNRKPYRNKRPCTCAQDQLQHRANTGCARRTHSKGEDGAHYSYAPVAYHPDPSWEPNKTQQRHYQRFTGDCTNG